MSKVKLDCYKEIKLSEGTATPENNSVSVDIGNGWDSISFTKEDLDIMYKLINGEYEVSTKKPSNPFITSAENSNLSVICKEATKQFEASHVKSSTMSSFLDPTENEITDDNRDLDTIRINEPSRYKVNNKEEE